MKFLACATENLRKPLSPPSGTPVAFWTALGAVCTRETGIKAFIKVCRATSVGDRLVPR